MKIDRSVISDVLWQVGIPARGIALNDASFQTIETAEVQDLHSKWTYFLPDVLIERRIVLGRIGEVRCPRWIEECWDCDNHASDFVTFCCRSNAYTKMKTGEERGGLALGRISYVSESNGRIGPHAANLFITKDLKLWFFEPAEGRVIDLTEKERKGAWGVTFI